MADSQTQNLRILKIKTGVVKRLMKDKLSYEKEAADQVQKIEAYRKEGKDEYFLKQQVNSLKETELMIPDTQRRLQAAFDDLKSITDTHEDNEDVIKTEEYKAAFEILKEAKSCLEVKKGRESIPPLDEVTKPEEVTSPACESAQVQAE